MIRRWHDAPVLVRRAVLGLVLVLVYGTGVHLFDLVSSGGDPYPELPRWLQVYFVSLTALDPVAAVLLALRRRSGVVLAVAVLVTDAIANGYANYVLNPVPGGRVGHAVITALALATLALAPALWRHARPVRRPGRPAPVLPGSPTTRRRLSRVPTDVNAVPGPRRVAPDAAQRARP